MLDATRQIIHPRKHRFNIVHRLPSEHGFWVMLVAAQTSALLRARGTSSSLIAAAFMAGVVVVAGSVSHRLVRKNSVAQLIAAVALSLSSVPVEIAGGVLVASVAWAALARVVVFVTSALVVQAAFARCARNKARRSLILSVISWTLPALSAALLLAVGHTVEAGTCVIAGAVCVVFAWSRPTVKQLKPLGLALGGLALLTVVTLAL